MGINLFQGVCTVACTCIMSNAYVYTYVSMYVCRCVDNPVMMITTLRPPWIFTWQIKNIHMAKIESKIIRQGRSQVHYLVGTCQLPVVFLYTHLTFFGIKLTYHILPYGCTSSWCTIWCVWCTNGTSNFFDVQVDVNSYIKWIANVRWACSLTPSFIS